MPMRNRESGVVLIIAIIMLMIIGMISVTAVKGLSSSERMAGQAQEKQRTLALAESTVRHAERWLKTRAGPPTNACAQLQAPAEPIICADPLSNADAAQGWVDAKGTPVGIQYDPGNILVDPDRPRFGTYVRFPEFYIQYLGTSRSTGGNVYRITARAWGGNISTVSVLESTFESSAGARDLGRR